MPGVPTTPGVSPTTPGTAPPTPGTGQPAIPLPMGVVPLGPTSIARQSRAEYVASVKSLLGVEMTVEVEALPRDAFVPFDNEPSFQAPSSALIQGLGLVAGQAADKALATPAQRLALVGCMPTGPADEACFRSFVEKFGRRALHRPLSAAEVTDFVSFLPTAQQANDFYVGIGLVIQAMLQDLEFVYRTEIGSPVAGMPDAVSLTDWELGARLSYLLWGETPDDTLLANVEKGMLGTAAGFRTEATRLLADPRGIARINRFHSLWLGYEELPHLPALNAAYRTETDALLTRVVFEKGAPWFDLFTSPETYADQQLAPIYGLPTLATPGFSWITYPDATRAGILSQGALLSNGAKNGDSSPTLRGKFILERLLCTPIAPPPPGVNANVPAVGMGGTTCKSDRYAAHASGTCAGCHGQMDPIGFGLENYDTEGRFRTTDPGKPECAIAGTGQIPSLGAFKGPAELGQLLVKSDQLGQCLTDRIVEFAVQRPKSAEDAPAIAALRKNLDGTQFSLRDGLLAWLGSGSFRYRKIEPYTMQVMP